MPATRGDIKHFIGWRWLRQDDHAFEIGASRVAGALDVGITHGTVLLPNRGLRGVSRVLHHDVDLPSKRDVRAPAGVLPDLTMLMLASIPGAKGRPVNLTQ
jgi:hypothetical protein